MSGAVGSSIRAVTKTTVAVILATILVVVLVFRGRDKSSPSPSPSPPAGASAPADPTVALRLREEGERLLASKDFAAAIAKLEEANSRGAKVAELLTSARRQRILAEAGRRVDAALEVAKTKCENASALLGAWESIRGINKSNEHHARAVVAAAALDRCRPQAYQQSLKVLRSTRKLMREDLAKNYERKLLGEGLDVRVQLSGAAKEYLTIRYALFNRAWAFKLTDGGSTAEGSLLGAMTQTGFRRVTFSNGYDDTTYYDLTPPPDDVALVEMGLKEPFRFQ